MEYSSLDLLRVLGIPPLGSIWLLAARLVWEQTVVTWERGHQLIGFSLLHGLGALLVLAALASLFWPGLVLVEAVITKSFPDRKTLLMLGTYALGWVLFLTPYGFWQRLFIWKFTPAQSVELLTHAAAGGDIRTVQAFLNRGVDVNAQSRNGTALHAASVAGQLDVMEFLIAKGADVNAINPDGDSPMTYAVQARQRASEAEALLARHGGKIIRGPEEQRRHAMEEEFRRENERMRGETPK